MPVLRIPTPLRSYTAGQSEISVQGEHRRRSDGRPDGPIPILEAAPVQRDGDAAPLRQPVRRREQYQRPARVGDAAQGRRPFAADPQHRRRVASNCTAARTISHH